MKKMTNHTLMLLMLVLAGTLWQGCRKDFDEPPVDELPVLTANTTIAQLKALHTLGSTPTLISDDLVIEGIIVADDKSGNFYKSLVIQDTTGGLELRLDATELYTNYPVGRKVWVKCQNLYIGDYSNKMQLVANANSDAIANGLIANYVYRGPVDQFVTPAVRTISQLTDADVNTLIKIENAEFAAADMNKTYADAINKLSVNLNILDCNGGSILLRSSGYCDFAGTPVPDSSGYIVAVYSVFGTDKQLFIRDPSDVSMTTGTRCTGGGNVSGDVMNIGDLRDAFTGAAAPAPSGKKIRGYVVSDVSNGNWLDKNLVVQDATGGITARFTSAHGFVVGDEIEIATTGSELSEFNGLLQLNNVSNANAVLLSSGNSFIPNTVTIAQILANFEDYESSLVKITGATITGGGTYSGSKTVNDGTGNIILYTYASTTFANTTVPSGTVEITAVVNQYNTTNQLMLRDANDVVGGQTITYDMNETFNSVTVNAPVALSGWTVVAQTGTEKWEGRSFSGNFYARASAYQASPADVATWIITPAINLTQNKYLSFDSEWGPAGAWDHNGLTAWISTDFNGSNVATATWTQLSATISTSTDVAYSWVSSGNISLSAYTGSTVYIGFKYTGSDPNQTTNYDIDNVRIWNQ